MKVQLLAFPGCPNEGLTKTRVRKVLAELGLPNEIEEVDVSASSTAPELRGWPSPTVLVDGKDVEGMAGMNCPGCRLYPDQNAPSEAAIRVALRGPMPRKGLRGLLAGIPALGASLLPALTCPACLGPLASVLSALGLSFILYSRVFVAVFLLALAFGVFTMARATRHHRNPWPLALTVIGTLAIVMGRFVLQNEMVERIGIPFLLAGPILSFWLLGRPPSPRGTFMKNARSQWLLAGGAVVVAIAAMGLLYALTPRNAPASQRAFLALEAKNMEELRTAFNAAADRPRVIAFLSPT